MRNQFNISNKQDRPTLQRRFSLKPSQLSNSKSTIRMSIPSRRDSISINTLLINDNQNQNTANIPPFRQYKQARSSFTSSISVQLPVTSQKQVILNNLVRKLNHQQQLKQIIQSKIKKTSDYQYSRYRYDPGLQTQIKLKKCQEQLDYYKDVVKNLMRKMSDSSFDCLKFKSKTQQVSTQTQNTSNNNTPFQSSRDFMQNLDKTLKVLAGRKGI